jgi:hypothetical protein
MKIKKATKNYFNRKKIAEITSAQSVKRYAENSSVRLLDEAQAKENAQWRMGD